ncbi:hypothetical protein [Clostridium ganghwense]|uniref:Uncharacterized protein n=1 Tax=Clostridium ganghwense TaxID=312089 RepID=A0ABT4CLA0_9CLOT|nr:hypothetical protein [Clostridium ganghwense]MCY6369026.1 hypothetical protein [Clostridium ganghwense]
MDWSVKVQKIIDKDKWTKNSITMSRVQCGKLVEENDKLMLFIVSDILDKPFYTRVERVLVADNQIIAFYDGEYGSLLEENEYNKFSAFFKKEEWDILFGGNTIDRLDKMNMISEEEGFYIEAHETMESFLGRYDKNATEQICTHYKL